MCLSNERASEWVRCTAAYCNWIRCKKKVSVKIDVTSIKYIRIKIRSLAFMIIYCTCTCLLIVNWLYILKSHNSSYNENIRDVYKTDIKSIDLRWKWHCFIYIQTRIPNAEFCLINGREINLRLLHSSICIWFRFVFFICIDHLLLLL